MKHAISDGNMLQLESAVGNAPQRVIVPSRYLATPMAIE